MGSAEHKGHSVKNIGFAVITVSDTRTEATDESGCLIKALLEEKGHKVERYAIVKDEAAIIAAETNRCLSIPSVGVVVLTGGTGIARRDVTPEAVRPLLDRELPGFGELFRAMSAQEIGGAAMMSRAFAGVAKGKAVFALPGSKSAVELAMKRLVLEEVGHIIWEAGR